MNSSVKIAYLILKTPDKILQNRISFVQSNGNKQTVSHENENSINLKNARLLQVPDFLRNTQNIEVFIKSCKS